MYPYGNRANRNPSGRAEGRFLEPSQLRLQATGSSVSEKSSTRDTVKPAKKFEALDFRLTKDSGVVKAASDLNVGPSSSIQSGLNGTRKIKVDQSSLPDGLYFPSTKPNGESVSESGVRSKTVRSSSAVVNQQYSQSQGAPTNVDVVMVAEAGMASGVPIIYRTPEERATNPDRLNLDRRRLTICPILDGEDSLRLLSYQHNLIRKISNVHNLKKLIFLDLYDNQIEEISGLSQLKSLRVLMLGKNRIHKIEHLDNVTKLDVLDLHGNQIQVIENLNHLIELRVLNLAGNRIGFVDNLAGMMTLTELNLRRNSIKSLTDINQLPSLLRLFLSCNELASFDDISCLTRTVSIQEISLDGNPLAGDQFYKQTILSNMPQIKQLDMKRVTDEEKRISSLMAKKEEDRKKEVQKISLMKEKRRQAIHTAKKQWEVMQSSMMGKSNRLNQPELFAQHIGTYENEPSPQDSENEPITDSSPDINGQVVEDRAQSALGNSRDRRNMARFPAKDRSQSESRPHNPIIGHRPTNELPINRELGNGLAELDNDTLTCYGPGSVDSLDRSWGVQAAGCVTRIVFKFIEFADVVTKAFNKIRIKFPAVHTYEFNSNNIHSLEQLNSLALLRRIENLIVKEEGNPVTLISNWKYYILFRLAHMNVKTINGEQITASDILTAEKVFGPVSVLIGSSLPSYRLLALLPDVKKKQYLSEEKSKNSAASSDPSVPTPNPYGSETTNRACLTFSTVEQQVRQSQEVKEKVKLARSYINYIAKECVSADHRLDKLDTNWNKYFTELVQSICIDVYNTESYIKQSMSNFNPADT